MAEIVLILARRGMGKTTMLQHLIDGWPGPVFGYDPMDQLDTDGEASEESLLVRGSLLALDEINLLAGPHGYRAPWVERAVHFGRHLGVTIIGTTRRAANIHRDLSALATLVYLGRITEPRDIKYCVDAWGEEASNISDLPPYHFIEITP